MDYYTRNIEYWIKSFIKKERRIKVMRKMVPHVQQQEPFGGHLGEEKTRERIKLSFVWPKV